MIEKVAEAEFPTKFGQFRLYAYLDANGKEHLALVKGTGETAVVRIHSKCLTGDTLGSLRCDCRGQLEKALEIIGSENFGALIYLDQEGRGIGLCNKIKAYRLQDEGKDTVEANLELGFAEDLREYSIAAEILESLGITRIELMTNNPDKVNELEKNGIKITGRIPLQMEPNEFNKKYLQTKKEKMDHMLD